jgi:L-amino acid N-acyltransferase YncA
MMMLVRIGGYNIFPAFIERNNMRIRLATEADFPAMWRIFQEVVSSETTYVFKAGTSREDAHAYWFGPGVTSYVAGEETGDDARIAGMYKIVANQRDLGAHVANASFMVDPRCGGKGTGKLLAIDCLAEARKAGYLAMQFNFVVSTNTAAVALWRKLGFVVVGTLPKVFAHKTLGLVDAHVMHRFLDDL